MKTQYFLFFLVMVLCGCNQKLVTSRTDENTAGRKKIYEEYLDMESAYVVSFGNFMVEKTEDDKYIRKQFYPSNEQITHYYVYTDPQLMIKNGIAKEWWDNGDIALEGQYKDNLKTGIWKEYQIRNRKSYAIGEYKKGLPIGVWKVISETGVVVEEISYRNGKKHGAYKIYSEDGRLLEKGVYENDNRSSQEFIDSESEPGNKEIQKIDEMPLFKGCEHIVDFEKRRACGDEEMLTFIYGNIKYPADAREQGIEGKVITTFDIDKKGKVRNIKVLRGISDDIKEEVIRILKSMPKWNPGHYNGQPVKFNFILPVNFRLE